jgi:uncharacterized membrane protein YdjX (TVP38/TMEM64 family)
VAGIGLLVLLPIVLTAELKSIEPMMLQTLRHHQLWLAAGCFLCGVFGVSRQLLASISGYLLGFWQGLLLIELAMLASAVAVFAIGRLLQAERLSNQRFVWFQVLTGKLQRAPFTGIFLLRLLPVGSNLLTNLAAGAFHLPLTSFVLGSALGYLPQHIIFALLGQGIQLQSITLLLWALAAFALLSAVLFHYRHFWKTNEIV